jgi:hypothetical protein
MVIWSWVHMARFATLKNSRMNGQEPSSDDKTRHSLGPHWVREKECVSSCLPTLAKNVNYFKDSMVSAVGIEPTTL